MEIEINEVTALFADFSMQKVLNGDFTLIASVMYLVLTLAIYAVMIWYFYRFIATRDFFSVTNSYHPILKGTLEYFLIYPLVATLFFTGFAFILIFLTRNFEMTELLATSFALVVVIRLTAYYSEDLSKDVAKMLPFAVLGLVLVNPTFFNYEDIIITFNTLPEFFTLCLQFILFIVLLEWSLRILLFIKHLIWFSRDIQPTTSEPSGTH